jgi:hypothetical protein
MQMFVAKALAAPFAALWASKVLSAVGLGVVAPTNRTAAGGRSSWFFVKKVLTLAEERILQVLGVTLESTPSLEAYKAVLASEESLPLRATAVDWSQVADVPQDLLT